MEQIRQIPYGVSDFRSVRDRDLYYDKLEAENFEKLFGDLYIGQHPTPLRNKYQVLYLDFSQIGGGMD